MHKWEIDHILVLFWVAIGVDILHGQNTVIVSSQFHTLVIVVLELLRSFGAVYHISFVLEFGDSDSGIAIVRLELQSRDPNMFWGSQKNVGNFFFSRHDSFELVYL